MSKILIALGGNALGKTPEEQKEAVKITAKAIVNLYQKGHSIVICHGNGPQVGMINNTFLNSYSAKQLPYTMPFPECGALSQGYIGFHIQNAIANELKTKNIDGSSATIVTQTLVAKSDPAFNDYSKPIGSFYEEQVAKNLAKKNNWIVKEDAGRGWRRVVASPKPIDILEKKSVKTLLQNNIIVIAGGGGGVPVIEDHNQYIGVDAVIDKDFTSAKLAEIIDADVFIILTAVEKININWGKADQKALSETTVKELEVLIRENQFAPGSMLPKVKAVISFVENTGKDAYIGELKLVDKILSHQTGTKISK